jgi:transcriptional regulator with XRE-family HTH domain
MGARPNARALKRLGARIRELRRKRELSQEALAFDAGIHTNHLSAIERGEANPSFLVLLSVARVLQVSVADLVTE